MAMITSPQHQLDTTPSWEVVTFDGHDIIAHHPALHPGKEVTVVRGNKTDFTREGAHVHNIYLVTTIAETAGILVHASNSCVKHAAGACSQSNCHKYHFEPRSVVSALIGRHPILIGVINPRLMQSRELIGKVNWSTGQRATITSLRREQIAAMREQLALANAQHQEDDDAEAELEEMNAAVALAMQPRAKRRRKALPLVGPIMPPLNAPAQPAIQPPNPKAEEIKEEPEGGIKEEPKEGPDWPASPEPLDAGHFPQPKEEYFSPPSPTLSPDVSDREENIVKDEEQPETEADLMTALEDNAAITSVLAAIHD